MMKQPLSLRNTQRISFRSSFSVSPQVSNTTLYLNSLIITPPESMLMALILYSKSQVCQTVLLPGFCLTSPLPLARKWPKTAFNSRENTLNVAFSTPPGYKDCLWVIFDPAVKITVTQSQLQTTHTHTHTHTHLTHTVLIDIRQNQNSPSAGVPSPFHDPIHSFQRPKFKQFHTQPSRPCFLTLLHSECKDAAGDKTFSSLCAAEHRSETSGRGRPLRSPCWFMLFTFDYYWWCLQ